MSVGQGERDVLGTVSASNSEKCWNTMPMPRLAGGRGVGDGDRLALPADLARGRLQRAVDDLDQRRLAGAVLAEQRVDLARRDGEVDAVVGPERAEILGDADGLQRRCAGRPAEVRDSSPRPLSPSPSSPPLRSPSAWCTGCVIARSASSRMRSSVAVAAAITAGSLGPDAADADRADECRDARRRDAGLGQAAARSGRAWLSIRSGRHRRSDRRASAAWTSARSSGWLWVMTSDEASRRRRGQRDGRFGELAKRDVGRAHGPERRRAAGRPR